MNSKLTPEQAKHIRQSYRDKEPSSLFKKAYTQVITTGSVNEDLADKLVEQLYEPFSEQKKQLGGPPADNCLMRNVEREPREIRINVSEKLFNQQPIGVLLRPINEQVRQAGEGVIWKREIYSKDVRPEVMPLRHHSLKVQPTPLWLESWIGDDGYPTINAVPE